MIKIRAVGAALLGSVLLSGLLAAPAEAVGCVPVVTAAKVNEVIIYAEAPSRASASVTAYDPCGDYDLGIWWMTGEAYASGTHYFDLAGAETHSTAKTTWTGQTGADFDTYNTTGQKKASFEVYDQDVTRTIKDVYFYVRRNVTMPTHNASPEPVRKGSAIKVSGTVKRLSVNSLYEGRYVAYANHMVKYYFRAAGTSSYVLKGYSYTNSSGAFAKSFTASVDGYWYARSIATSTYRSRSGTPDFVDVVS